MSGMCLRCLLEQKQRAYYFYDPSDVAMKLGHAHKFSGERLEARHKIARFENKIVASKLKEVYESVATGKRDSTEALLSRKVPVQ